MRESRSGGYSLRKLEGRNDYNEAQHKSADMSPLARSPITTLRRRKAAEDGGAGAGAASSRAEACSQAAAVDNLGNIFGRMVPDANPAGKSAGTQ